MSALPLQVEGASKSYGALKALDDVTLGVGPGEFVALLGPNGAGKTTLFQILTGLFVADRGRIVIDGLDIRRHLVTALARLGVVFQQPTLDLDLTVEANLRFHARLHGLPRGRATARMADELARIGLAGEEGRACRALSGGNRRKVELARALLHEPRVLVLDEPTVGLDPASRRSLLAHVRALCRDRGLERALGDAPRGRGGTRRPGPGAAPRAARRRGPAGRAGPEDGATDPGRCLHRADRHGELSRADQCS